MASITVTKVGVLSIGKLFGTVNLIIGLAVGIVATVAGIIAYFAADNYGFFEGLLGSIGIALAGLVLYPLNVRIRMALWCARCVHLQRRCWCKRWC